MNDALLTVIAAILGYSLFIGITWALLPDGFAKDKAITPMQHIAALIWPIVLPTLIGVAIVRRVRDRSNLPKASIHERTRP
jgi:hypothetical protein